MLNTAIKTKNAFDEVINRQDIANERISDLKGRPIEKSQTKMKREKKRATTTTTKYSRTVRQLQQV